MRAMVTPLCCPPRMPDARRPLQRVGFEQSAQILNAARFLANPDFIAVQHSDARTVGSTILESPQPFDQKVGRLSVADVCNDPAHIYRSSLLAATEQIQ